MPTHQTERFQDISAQKIGINRYRSLFTSARGREYSLNFSDAKEYLEDFPNIPIYELSIDYDRSKPSEKGGDYLVMETVKSEIDWFSKKYDSIFYLICSDEDKKNLARSILFRRAFKRLGKGYVKINRTIHTIDMDTEDILKTEYLSIIVAPHLKSKIDDLNEYMSYLAFKLESPIKRMEDG